jgi:hypothetical protein
MTIQWKTLLAWAPVLLTALSACASSGCGDGRAPTFPVSGQVLVNGKPAEGAFVVFHPKDGGEKEKNVPRPYATTNAEGKFQLTTYEEEDGAPAGNYRVSVVWRPVPKSRLEAEGPDKLKGKYSNPATSGLDAEISKAPETALKPFQLAP